MIIEIIEVDLSYRQAQSYLSDCDGVDSELIFYLQSQHCKHWNTLIFYWVYATEKIGKT